MFGVFLLWHRTFSCLQSNENSSGIGSKPRKMLEHSVPQFCPLVLACVRVFEEDPWQLVWMGDSCFPSVYVHRSSCRRAGLGLVCFLGCSLWLFMALHGEGAQPREWESWSLAWTVTL